MGTDNLRRVFSGYGSPVITCACKCINYAGQDDCMEEGEMDRLLEDRERNPEKKYQCHNQDTHVSAVVINGSSHVWGCQCKWDERLAALLDNHQGQILDYYKNKIQRQRHELDLLEQQAKAAGIA